jgi:hypothetical protein
MRGTISIIATIAGPKPVSPRPSAASICTYNKNKINQMIAHPTRVTSDKMRAHRFITLPHCGDNFCDSMTNLSRKSTIFTLFHSAPFLKAKAKFKCHEDIQNSADEIRIVTLADPAI